jgi:2'-5' RNA ligase
VFQDLATPSGSVGTVSPVNEPTESAVIVACPEAEAVVGPHRERFDRSAADGVPAHVTVIYPFVPPSDVDAGVIEALAPAIAAVPRFEVRFETTGWFGTEVLWLDPRPDEPFRALTTAVFDAFPDYPPYGGVHDDVVPHLTVGTTPSPQSFVRSRNECARSCRSTWPSPLPPCGSAATPAGHGAR